MLLFHGGDRALSFQDYVLRCRPQDELAGARFFPDTHIDMVNIVFLGKHDQVLTGGKPSGELIHFAVDPFPFEIFLNLFQLQLDFGDFFRLFSFTAFAR